MKYLPAIRFFLIVAFLSTGCKISYQPVTLEYQSYRVAGNEEKDIAVQQIIQPYSDSVNKSMNDVVGFAKENLDKKSPAGPLGNFMADAFLMMAREKFNTKVDIAFMNFGGIRLNQLPAGPVTRGKIFELMPFDNLLILQKLKGTLLQQFLDHTASRGGWPVAGISMQVKDTKAVNVMIGGKALDPNAVYTVANSDFIANGGDNSEMLKPIPQHNIGYLMRDALFDYIRKLKSAGQDITASHEIRVTHV